MDGVICAGIGVRLNGRPVLRTLDLELAKGRITALMGPSGAGKTTLARTLCGLQKPWCGNLAGDGLRRPMLMSQDFVVWPKLTVRENVELGLPPGRKKVQASDPVQHWLQVFGMAEHAGRQAGQLSYGQQQRVALARCMVFEPTLLLLDEPFIHLDSALRRQIQAEVQEAVRSSAAACLWICHEPREALELADQLALLVDGQIIQCGTPDELYWGPCSLQAAQLLGEISIISPAAVSALDGNHSHIRGGPTGLLGIRPSGIRADPNSSGKHQWIVERAAGDVHRYEFRIGPGHERVLCTTQERLQPNQRVSLRLVREPVLL